MVCVTVIMKIAILYDFPLALLYVIVVILSFMINSLIYFNGYICLLQLLNKCFFEYVFRSKIFP